MTAVYVTEEGRDPDDQTFPVAIKAFVRAQARVGGNLPRIEGDCRLDLEDDRKSTRSKELAIVEECPLRCDHEHKCPLCHGHGTVECDLEHPDDEPVGVGDSDDMEWRRATTALAAMGAGPMVATAGALASGMMRQALDTEGSGDGGDGGSDYRWRQEWNPEVGGDEG